MIVTGENRRTRIKFCPSATLSTTNTTWTARASAVRSRRLTPVLWYGLVTLVTIITRGIPGWEMPSQSRKHVEESSVLTSSPSQTGITHSAHAKVIDPIRQWRHWCHSQWSNSGEHAKTVKLCVHFLTCLFNYHCHYSFPYFILCFYVFILWPSLLPPFISFVCGTR
jgi:hypothetical protein